MLTHTGPERIVTPAVSGGSSGRSRPDGRSIGRGSGMELNGARSNPRAGVELSRLRDVQRRLLRKAAANPMEPRPAPVRPSPVLETITRVLELENRPMRAREIYSAAEELLGRPLLWKSVKGTLFNYAQGRMPRFVRVGRGVYNLAAARSAISENR